MAFKKMVDYNEERYGNFLTLADDGNSAKVIFMYQSQDDVMICDTHYIKSAEYNGYIQCNGSGCSACAKGIRTQTKLFIPMYDIENKKLIFWDRTTFFESQLMRDVFTNFPNPSEYVFEIVRHGVARDRNTTYSIQCIGKNSISFDSICAGLGVKFPDAYNIICPEIDNAKLASMLNQNPQTAPAGTANQEYNYDFNPIPRSDAAVPNDFAVPAQPPIDLTQCAPVGMNPEADLPPIPTVPDVPVVPEIAVAAPEVAVTVPDSEVPFVEDPQSAAVPTEVPAPVSDDDIDNVAF